MKATGIVRRIDECGIMGQNREALIRLYLLLILSKLQI